MRDVVLTLILSGGLIAAVRRPWFGVILWALISLMNPHRLTWGFAYSIPWAQMTVAATFLGMALRWRDVKMHWSVPTVVFVVFTLWQCVTYPSSFYPDLSRELWMRVLKINFMILVTIALIHTRRHLDALVWAIVAGLGFYGVKGGLFTLATGGSYRVWGPSESFIAGNNEVALALVMTIPLMYYLREVSSKRYVKNGLLISMVLMAVAALGSHSRGALLAIGAMLGLLMLKSPKKVPLGFGLLLLGGVILSFMPEEWWARMLTIQDYEEDASAMGRINAWWLTWNVATTHFFGGGYYMYTPEIYARFAPVPGGIALVAHSIYFSVLGEHGFVGLGLFLLVWAATWRTAGWIERDPKLRGLKEYEWARKLSAMVKVALVGYLVGGAFQNLAYFDLPYYMLALVVICRAVVEHDRVASAAAQAKTPNLPSVSLSRRVSG